MEKDPLEDLLLDADQVDKARISKAIKDVLGIDSTSGDIVLKPGFDKLTVRKKLIACLLGRKVAKLLKKIESEEMLPKDISEKTGINASSTRVLLSELKKKERCVSTTNDSEYYIAPYQINLALKELDDL